jgi:NitT/TauT family transport system permease protein
MFIGVLLYDQLFFRPLLAWADKFRFEETGSETAQQSWLLDFLQRTERLRQTVEAVAHIFERSIGAFRLRFDGTSVRAQPHAKSAVPQRVWDAALAALVFYAVWTLIRFVHSEVGWSGRSHVFVLGCYTMIRVIVLIFLAALIWIPVGV